MKLSPEEVIELNRYLFNALKQKGFDVKISNKSGYIKDVSKLGVSCLPGICHSYVDGKQEYSYMCLTAGVVDSSDLGYYCLKEKDCALVKYSQESPVKINIRNYGRIIDAFVKDLDETYTKYVKGKVKLESKLTTRVKIKATGDAFEGKDGVLEEEKGDTLTVLVNFDNKGRKVRQYFKKENIEYIKSETLLEDTERDFWQMWKLKNESINEEKEDDIPFDVITIDDKRLLALALYLKVNPQDIVKYNELHTDAERSDNIYVVMDKDLEDAAYVVLTATEAYDEAYQSAKDYYEEDSSSFVGSYYLDNFVDSDYMDRFWEESEREQLHNLEETDLFEEAFRENILDKSDFKLDESGEPIFDEPIKNIDTDVLIDKLLEILMKNYHDGISWFRENFGEREFQEFVTERGLIDIEAVVEDSLEQNGFGYWIARYDNVEIDLDLVEKGENVYAYRIN